MFQILQMFTKKRKGEIKMAIIEVTKDNFKQIVEKGTIVLDFWAPWCGPCRMLGPVLDQLASENDITVGKVNVDEQEDLAAEFNISSIPALFLMKDGKVVNKTVGYQSLDQLKEFIK